jgi:hypothetical protein
VPSIIDLALAMAEVVEEAGGVMSEREGRNIGTGLVKRRYMPSGYAQKTVIFEASESSGLEDDEVKHCDADGTCNSGNV